MYFHEPLYDLDILARQNLHIHTNFSNCAKAEMTVAGILAAAKAAGLQTIALTDHFNLDNTNKQCLKRNTYLRKEVDKFNTDITVLLSGELSAFAPGKSLENETVRCALDYRLYSCNHYHLDFWGQPEDKSLRGYAEYSLEIIRSIILSGKADCIAHPLIGRFIKAFEDRTLVTKEITDCELGDLLTLAQSNEVAFEINTGAILGDPQFGRRLWNIGKEIGVVFNYGTDAHTLASIDTKIKLNEMKQILL